MEEKFMNKIVLRKTAIIARQILLYFLDFNNALFSVFDRPGSILTVPLKEYEKFREEDKINFGKEISRLNQEGFVKKYFDGKDEMIELSEKGKKRLKKYVVDQLEVIRPNKWDRKWRMVVFDIPDSKKRVRDVVRIKLEQLGFLKLQESVYVFPFECLEEINYLKNIFSLSPYIQYIVADRIETEIDLLKKFYDRGILTKNMYQ